MNPVQPGLFDAPPVLDHAESCARRDHGIAVIEARRGGAVDLLVEVITALARRMATVTSDDVHVELANRQIAAPAPNAFGAAFRKAAMAGLIKDSGRATKSDRPAAHSRRLPIWESRILPFGAS